MQTIIPPKLKAGDTIRVISPATSLAVISEYRRNLATQRLTDMGLQVTFSEHVAETDLFSVPPTAARLEDLHAAFRDPNVQGILTNLGGYTSNHLLSYIDYDLIRANPKVFCGFSDITALGTAIYTKTGLVTYSGPHYSTFAMLKGIDYTATFFQRCVMQIGAYNVPQAPTWSDDLWANEQEQRTFSPTEGYDVIHEGEAEGRLLGGNLGTLALLHGTPFMPDLSDSILLVEDDLEITPQTFDRILQSLIQQPQFERVRGIIIGRFQIATQMDDTLLRKIIANKPELNHLPIIAQASFGHTTPQFTFPIGGTGKLFAQHNHVSFTIEQH